MGVTLGIFVRYWEHVAPPRETVLKFYVFSNRSPKCSHTSDDSVLNALMNLHGSLPEYVEKVKGLIKARGREWLEAHPTT